MTDAPKLKDYYTAELVEALGARFVRVYGEFDTRSFVGRVFSSELEPFDDLTFTGRAQRIADALHGTLDMDVPLALDALVAVLSEELDEPNGVLSDGFWMWPLGMFIATYAVDDYEPAMAACYELTKRFTSEFAIRPFLERYPEALDRLTTWAVDPNEHVRRLVSEGTRSRLPWASRLSLPVDRVIDLLTMLRHDSSLYVRRSVANHLNDLAKDDSDRIVELLENWYAEDVEESRWIVRHALRNHLKAGDPRVLRLFGYEAPDVDVMNLSADPARVNIGETVRITFDVVSKASDDQKLMIDLVVGYTKANGVNSPKVFKFRDITLPPARAETYAKSLQMIERSTRVLYPGRHTVRIRVNGVDTDEVAFDLAPEPTGSPRNRQ